MARGSHPIKEIKVEKRHGLTNLFFKPGGLCRK